MTKRELATENMRPAVSAVTRAYDVERVRAEFPVLHQRVRPATRLSR